jgi:hypothetical protein
MVSEDSTSRVDMRRVGIVDGIGRLDLQSRQGEWALSMVSDDSTSNEKSGRCRVGVVNGIGRLDL